MLSASQQEADGDDFDVAHEERAAQVAHQLEEEEKDLANEEKQEEWPTTSENVPGWFCAIFFARTLNESETNTQQLLVRRTAPARALVLLNENPTVRENAF